MTFDISEPVLVDLDDETPNPPDRSADQLLIVDMSQVYVDPFQPRRNFNALEELASSIKARGLLKPIEVRPHPTIHGSYMIKDGERRWRACGMNEMEQVQVIVRSKDDEKTLVMDQLTANWHAESMTPLEEADAIEREIERLRLEGHPNPRERVRAELGISASVLSKKMAVLKYPKEIRDLLDKKLIREYQSVKNLSMLKSDDQAEMIKEVREGRFNAKAFNKSPAKYLKEAKAKQEVGGVEGGGIDTSPMPKPANPVLIRWGITKEVLALLIANTAFSGVMEGISIVDLDDEQLKGVFEKFRDWLLDPGESAG